MISTLIASILFSFCASDPQMPWVTSYSAAIQSAKSTQHLILIDFYADWCTWCKRLDSDTFSHPEVIKLGQTLVPLRVNAEKEGSDLAQRYGVKGLPRVLLIDVRGEVWCSIRGYLPPHTFANEVQKGLDAHAMFRSSSATLKRDPADGEANALFSYVLTQRQKLKEAQEYLSKAVGAKYTGKFMGRACNALGEALFGEHKNKEAAKFFEMVRHIAASPDDQAYSLVSLGYCYKQSGDREAARKVCNEAILLRDAPDELVTMAREILASLDK